MVRGGGLIFLMKEIGGSSFVDPARVQLGVTSKKIK